MLPWAWKCFVAFWGLWQHLLLLWPLCGHPEIVDDPREEDQDLCLCPAPAHCSPGAVSITGSSLKRKRSQEPNTDSAGGSAQLPSPPVSPVPTPVCVGDSQVPPPQVKQLTVGPATPSPWDRVSSPSAPSVAHPGTFIAAAINNRDQTLCASDR